VRAVGIPVFGPSSRAARMEGSKAFSKEFMRRNDIPTAQYRIFTASQYAEAARYIKDCNHKIVLKASGLAAGKGVLLPDTQEAALEGLKNILLDRVFGEAGRAFHLVACTWFLNTPHPHAGSEVVIEERLEGPELSILAFSDGYTIVPLPAAQDHKRIGEGDTGPNTGGMGAYAPAPIGTPDLIARIQKETLQPTVDGMRREGKPNILTYAIYDNISWSFCPRVPLCRTIIHWLHVNFKWTEGFGIQC
jgi:phosphoribosylamine--glycine ligase / phosphoribosylformylglycinamidine cyclo-ligase